MSEIYHQHVIRNWGTYTVLYEGKGFKVKELVINPHSSLSKQKHQHRTETWNIVSGECFILLDDVEIKLEEQNGIYIPKDTWHKGMNRSEHPAHIIEIWRGEILTESDIERQKLVM